MGNKKNKKTELLKGVFQAHEKGFGFILFEDGDFFVSRSNTQGAFNGDTVEFEEIRPDRRRKGASREARVVRIAERGIKTAVGTFEYVKGKGYGFVVCDDKKIFKDIFVDKANAKGASDGDKVVAEILSYGDAYKNPEGAITEVLGREGEPGVDMDAAVRVYGVEEDFDEATLAQANRANKPLIGADFNGRRDLRDLQMVTIDGEDSKDLDDAVSLSRGPGGERILGVHIADVSNYVQEGSKLDRAAFKRGTSIYLPDRVIPMLPVALSNGICSLNQHEDRLALSCLMTVDEAGKVVASEIVETVINVDRRMTYTEVDALLDGSAAEELKDECRELLPVFKEMLKLSEEIRTLRSERGAISFDFAEAKIELDERGRAVQVRPYIRGASAKMIEDFMLSANETVAETFYYMQLPFVYRSHEKPDYEDVAKLRSAASNLGLHLKASKDYIHPRQLQELLEAVKGRPEEGLISTMALRAMKRARYTTTADGHFGLAFEYYCHFTSPIRRYPDLQIHRIIKDQLRGRMDEDRCVHYEELLPEAAAHSSAAEHNAQELERYADDAKKAEFMSYHIGEIYEGLISGVTSWGIYVQILGCIEGMIRVSDLEDDYYIYDPDIFELKGERHKKTFSLGQGITVAVERADMHTHEIDFSIIEQ